MKLKTFLKSCLILAAISVLFIPATVLAEEEECDLYVGGVEVMDSGTVTGEGITGTVDYSQTFQADILTLRDATITGINAVKQEDNDSAVKSNICIRPSSRTLIVNLVGENVLGGSDPAWQAIDARRDIIITGEGSLTLTNCGNGIWGDRDVTIDGNNHIYIDNKSSFSITADSCCITDGVEMDLSSHGYGAIRTEKDLMIYNSVVRATAEDSTVFESIEGNINIVNSDVCATLLSKKGVSYDSKAILAYWGKIRIANSSVIADNGIKDRAAIMARRGITLNHSEIIAPTNGKVERAEGFLAVTDSKGNVVPYAEISRVKAPSTMYAAGKTAKLKSGAKKLKKNKTIPKAKAYTVANANGTVTYAKVKANKAGSKFTVNKKTGKITVKKGLKNGTYKLTVKITDSGNDKHKEASKNVVVTIKVRK